MSLRAAFVRVYCDGCGADDLFQFRPLRGSLTIDGRHLRAAGWHDQPNFGKHFCPACKPSATQKEAEDEVANAEAD